MKTRALLALYLALAISGFAAPADFNAVSGYGTRLTGGAAAQEQFVNIFPGLDGPFYDAGDSEVVMENIALASEVDEGGGIVRLGFTLTFRNNGPGYYEEVFIEWERVGDGWQGVQVGDVFPVPDLVPNGTTSRPQPFEIRVPAAARDAAVADVLAGKHLRPIAIELFQFSKPAVAVDEATDDALASYADSTVPGATDITFSTSTPLLAALQPGTLLVESAYRYTLRRMGAGQKLSTLIAAPEVLPSGDTGGFREPKLMEVVSVAPQGGGGVIVTAKNVDFDEVMDTGTYFQRPQDALDASSSIAKRDIYRPPAGDNYISDFELPNQGPPPTFEPPDPPKVRDAARLLYHSHDSLDYGSRAIHVPFNELTIFNGITLDGEVLLDALNIELKVRLRGLQPRKISLKLATKTELTMRVSAEANAGNRNRPLVDREKDIFNLPLPGIIFAVGPVPIEIAPRFTGKVGVTIDAPTGVVIPIHGSLEAGCVMTWDFDQPPGQQYSYRPFHKSKPLTVSNPRLNDSLAFTATAFAEAGLAVEINRSAGPYFGARVQAEFELNPANNPWWSLDLNFQPVAKLRAHLLGFDLAEVGGFVGNLVNIGRKDPGVAVPGGSGLPGGSPPAPFEPVSGAETRWVRKAGTFPGAMKVARVAGTAEDVFTITEALLVSPPITRIGAKGEVVWSKGASLVAPQRMAATADGGLVFATGGSSSLVVWMDGAGNPVAARTFQPQDANGFGQVFYIGAIVAAPGGETFVIGSIAAGASDQDPFVVKYDANHDFVFAKRFETLNTVEYITDAALHPSGDLILCGTSDGRPDSGQFPGFELANMQGALLMRVTPAGNVEWGNRALPSFRFNSVTVAPDGTIYTAGQFFRSIAVAWPAMLVCRHDPATGIPAFLATYGETVTGANPTVQGLNGDVIPGAGFTAYDAATSIEWTPNGLIVGSNTAELPDVTTRAPMVMCLTEQFSLRWWSTHQTAAADDALFDLVPTAQGIFTAGYSRGLGPSDVNGDTAPAVLMKLPLEGKLDFGPVGARGNFVVPAIKQVPAYADIYPGLPSPPHGYLGAETLPFTPVAHPFGTSNVAPPTFTDVDIDYSAPLQRETTDAPLQSAVVTTDADTSRTSATLRGLADAPDASGTARFEWGTAADALTNLTPPIQVRRGQRNVDLAAGLTGLVENTQYFFRARLDVGGATLRGDVLNFSASNSAPVANNDQGLRIAADLPAVLAVLANDTDPDGDALTITAITSPPANGVASIAPDGKSILFDPLDGYTGLASLSYRISDGGLESDTADVSVAVGLERPSVPLISTLAATGDAVPDPALANAVLTGFGTPAISDGGAIVATTTFRVGRATATGIYFSDASGNASLLARSGASPVGLPDVAFASFGDPAISPGGAVAFTAKVRGRSTTPASDDGLWTNAAGGLRRVITEGGTLPFLGTARVAQIASFSIRDGEILALLKLKPGNGVNATNDSALVRITSDGNGTVLAREGSAVSATDPALVARISALMPALGSNGHGHTHGDGGYIAKLTAGTPKRDKLVVFEPDATNTTLLTTNDLAVPFGAGVRWAKFGLPAIDTTGGAWTAHATLKLGGTTANTDSALIFHDATANPLNIIAQENGAAPGTTANFASFLDPLVNSDQRIAFAATLRGAGITRANATGIWSGDPDNPIILGRTGSPATDAHGQPLAGVTWKSFTTQALPGLGGGPVFLATLAGTGVTAANRTALYAQDTAGNVRQFLRAGTPFDGKTIATISLLTAGNGPFDTSRSFNQQGALALCLTFTDRSQALVRLDVP